MDSHGVGKVFRHRFVIIPLMFCHSWGNNGRQGGWHHFTPGGQGVSQGVDHLGEDLVDVVVVTAGVDLVQV